MVAARMQKRESHRYSIVCIIARRLNAYFRMFPGEAGPPRLSVQSIHVARIRVFRILSAQSESDFSTRTVYASCVVSVIASSIYPYERFCCGFAVVCTM